VRRLPVARPSVLAAVSALALAAAITGASAVRATSQHHAAAHHGAAYHGAAYHTGTLHAQLTAESLVPPAAGGSAPAPSLGQVSARTTQLHRSILPDVFAILPGGISTTQLTRLRSLRHVRGVIAVDGGAVRVGGQLVNVIGVSPAQFRSWTPPQTADLQGEWTALAAGGFLATAAEAGKLHLKTGHDYQLDGAHQPSVTFAGPATLGLPSVDALVGSGLSRQLGLIHQIGVLLSVPRADVAKTDAAVRAVLGHQTRIVSLTETQNARQEQLPGNGTGSTVGRPANYLDLFRDSARRYCPGLSWTVLAAIGQIESGDGQNDGPSSAGALGPMQFMPSTWTRWGIDGFGETGTPDIMNPYDAVPAAADYLCAAGGGAPATLPAAIFAYNHAQWYVNEVLALAREYGTTYG